MKFLNSSNRVVSPFFCFRTANVGIIFLLKCLQQLQLAASSGLLQPRPIYEIHCSDHAEKGPEIVPAPFLAHEEQHERNKHADGYHFLYDLELRHVKPARRAKPVGGHRDDILDQGDEPTHEDYRVNRPARLAGPLHLEMPIPRKGHEEVAANEHPDSRRHAYL